MSSDETPHVPARRDRREVVREKAAQVQAQQRRGRVIRTSVLTAVIGALVIGAGVAVTWTLVSAASRPQASPTGLDGDAIVVDSLPDSVLAAFSGDSGDSGTDTPVEDAATPVPEPTASPSAGRVDIVIYVDYLSQASADFEMANAQQLSEWVSEGAATISYHPVALLTAKSNGTKYSLRAAAASACVATYEPDSFFSFNHELLAKKPDIDTDGYTDSQLADLAIAAGAEHPKVVRKCIEEERFVPWVQQATARALAEPLADDSSLTGPTVMVNGAPYVGAIGDSKEFAQFVLTLASDAYYTTPSPTPTDSPSPTATPSPAATP